MTGKVSLCPLPVGGRYEDTYGGWLSVFKGVAEWTGPIVFTEVPSTWASLLVYLGAEVLSVQPQFPEDAYVGDVLHYIARAVEAGRLRELVEMHSAARPELVDALYKSDMEWATARRLHTWQREFKVTCNGSFYRPEVLSYLEWWSKHARQTAQNCVLVPCAADKPYPAMLHKLVEERLPAGWEMIIATGVLGLVPRWAWDRMPLYDSGLPNQLRVSEKVESFFQAFNYDNVVIYSDFYGPAIVRGLTEARCRRWRWPLEAHFRGDYLPLHTSDYLRILSEAVGR